MPALESETCIVGGVILLDIRFAVQCVDVLAVPIRDNECCGC